MAAGKDGSVNFKLMGAIFVIGSCALVGFGICSSHRREVKTMRSLINLLDFMECELQYHKTPLPDLCVQAAKETTGILRELMNHFAQEMNAQISPNTGCCMEAAIQKTGEIPPRTLACLRVMGKSFGRFDLEGQMHGLDALRVQCRKELEVLTADMDNRLRSYQTLSICAGAALAILFV